jgi:hypothetical protein
MGIQRKLAGANKPRASGNQEQVSFGHFSRPAVTARVLTIRELAKYFRISRRQACEMLRREVPFGFPCFRAGGKWCVDLDQMREWMCQRMEEDGACDRNPRIH